MSIEQTRDRLADVLTDPLAAAGLDLEAVELSQAGRRRMLRVAVDKDGGVTLDDVADATRQVSRLLDTSEVMGEQPYTLEVSSRGTDRPLTLPRHWRRNAGRLVRLALHDGRSLTGRITAADDAHAVVEVVGSAHPESVEVSYDQVAKATIQVELNRRGPGHGEHDEEEA